MSKLRLLVTLLLSIFLLAPEVRAQQVAPADAERLRPLRPEVHTVADGT